MPHAPTAATRLAALQIPALLVSKATLAQHEQLIRQPVIPSGPHIIRILGSLRQVTSLCPLQLLLHQSMPHSRCHRQLTLLQPTQPIWQRSQRVQCLRQQSHHSLEYPQMLLLVRLCVAQMPAASIMCSRAASRTPHKMDAGTSYKPRHLPPTRTSPTAWAQATMSFGQLITVRIFSRCQRLHACNAVSTVYSCQCSNTKKTICGPLLTAVGQPIHGMLCESVAMDKRKCTAAFRIKKNCLSMCCRVGHSGWKPY